LELIWNHDRIKQHASKPPDKLLVSGSWIRSVDITGKVEERKASTFKVSKRNLASVVDDCQLFVFLE
jgi:hypothetical protein